VARRIVREGMWVGIGQAATAAGALAGLKILTSLLPADEYGRFALLLGLVAFGLGAAAHPLMQTILRFFPEFAERDQVGALRTHASRLLVRWVGAIAVVLAIGGALWSRVRPADLTTAAAGLAGGYLLAESWRLFESALLNSDRRQRDWALRNTADAWGKPLAAAALIVALGRSAASVFLGYAAASVAVTFALRGRTVRASPGAAAPDPAWLAEQRLGFRAFVLPLVPLAVLSWIMSLGDRYVLAPLAGPAAVGVYAAGYALASQPFIAANAVVHSTLRPVLYEAVSRGDLAKERRTLRVWLAIVAGISLTGVVGFTVLAPVLVRLFLGPAFGAAAELIPWLALAYALQNVQQTFEVIMYAHRRTRALAALQAVAAVVALALYVVLIPKFGALGAAWGTLGTFLVTAIVAAFLARAPRRLGFVPEASR